MTSGSPKAEIGKEYHPPGEADVIDEIVRFQLELMQATDPGKRGQHPKTVGCVRGEFSVRPDLPEALSYGVFAEPQTFPAVIRFSNAFGTDDRAPDFHGMAIKLLGVEGEKILEEEKDARTQDKVLCSSIFFLFEKILEEEKDARTQDFVLLNMPVFFASDVDTLLRFMRSKIAYDAQGMNPEQGMQKLAAEFPREVQLFVEYVSRSIASPLDIEYWSCVPSALGAGAAKYHIRPEARSTPSQSPEPSPDFLREAMHDRLVAREEEVRFEFHVQCQEDAATMPIEDATVEWKSPDQHVATISIAPQQFDTPENMEFGENLSFSPWHSLVAHRPLGGLNRARKRAYRESSKMRHRVRGASAEEPTA